MDKTQGIHVKEVAAAAPSITGVETAVPVFIGYTETAEQSGRSLHLQPVRISSLAEYQATFGGPFVHQFKLTAVPAGASEITLAGKFYRLDPIKRFYLYNALRLFYVNGGSSCYVVSVGPYDAPRIGQADLEAGLAAVQDLAGPTMLVIPEATLLYDPSLSNDKDAGCRAIAQQMVQQCANRRDRVAILDVWGAETLSPTPSRAELAAVIAAFRAGVESTPATARSFGMAYFPFLKTSIVDPAKELSDANFETGSLPPAASTPLAVTAIHALMAEKIGTLPPSAAVAGVYAATDAARGVWSAPANVSLAAVTGPAVTIDSEMQDDLNLPTDGLAVNAIRDFVGRGTVVWGARTLDGNSDDWRYIPARRTMIYVEQSIEQALQQVTFEPNTAPTWLKVVAMIGSFLHILWKAGGLAGTTPQQAYAVQCGLGSTMTAQDIADGYLKVVVQTTMLRPGEFIALTFKQRMEGGAG